MRNTLQNKKKWATTIGKHAAVSPSSGLDNQVTIAQAAITTASVQENRTPAGGFQFHLLEYG